MRRAEDQRSHFKLDVAVLRREVHALLISGLRRLRVASSNLVPNLLEALSTRNTGVDLPDHRRRRRLEHVRSDLYEHVESATLAGNGYGLHACVAGRFHRGN